MGVPFRQIAATVLEPGYYAEADASRAGTGLTTNRVLVFGQATALLATLALNAPVVVGGGQEGVMFGVNSMLAQEVAIARKAFVGAEIHAVPLTNAGAGMVAASGGVTITGTATAAGTLAAYTADKRYPVAVASGDTAADVMAAIKAAIDADVTAHVENVTITADDLDFDAVTAGTSGNSIRIDFNRGGLLASETIPPGLTVSTTQMAGGSGYPALAQALANLSDYNADSWVQPYSSTVALSEVEAAMSPLGGRWRWNVLAYGMAFTAFDGNLAAAIALGNSRNNPFESLMPVNGPNEPIWYWSAGFGATFAKAMANGPARSEVGLEIPCITPPREPFGWEDRSTLLGPTAGVSTFTVQEGKVYLGRVVTTYKTDSAGANDNAWMDANTVFTYMAWDRLLKQYSRHYLTGKTLVSSGSEVNSNPNIVSPRTYMAECFIPAVLEAQRRGLVENVQYIVANSRAERNATDPTRLDVFSAPDFANPLYVIGVLHQFRLQVTEQELAA